MNPYLHLVWIFPAAVLAFAACGDSGTTNTYVSASQDLTGIAVTGQGEVVTEPDTGFFNVGVQISAKTVGEARDKGAKAADDVIKSLKLNRIDEKDVKTTGLSISPTYEYPRNGGEPKITGYTLTNTVQVKVRKLDQFSKVVDDAIQAGGDAVRLNSIRFDIEDNAKALEQAHTSAMTDARKKAEQLAKAGGVQLDKPLAISETQSSAPPPQVFAGADKAAPSTGIATPIQPGTGTVTVQVQVRWSIK
jgi:hypothetical protein